MCGIAGIIQKKQIKDSVKKSFLDSAKLLNHRGPDYMGVYDEGNILLIHFRLSILDLDPRSHQPYTSASKKNLCVYNGEIYNYKTIQDDLKINCTTTSDTEVMIESYEKIGEKVVPKWNGIFAAVILNIERNQISIIRDRLGIKPLYYFENDEVIMFASEAKVILSYLTSFSLNYSALHQFIWFGNTTGTQTIVNGLTKIEPGTITNINLNNFESTFVKYWNYDQINKTSLNEKEIIEEIKGKLNNAVKRQLVSDVPLGVLLSGGVDSSGLVAMASKNTHGKIDTYSVDYDYNVGGKSELANAAKVASIYNTNHHELRVTTNDVKDIFSKLVFQYDEPFADPASIPLYQLSKVCSQDKRVILQGDGGDELFAGYSRYNVLGSYHTWKLASNLYPLLFFDNRKQERLKRLNFILSQSKDYEIISNYLTVETPYKNPIRVFSGDVQSVLLKTKWNSDYEKLIKPIGNISKLDKLLIADFNILLTNRYLEKVDKATMLCSIESRVPYLDNDLVDFALSIPSELKIKGNEKKYLLKKALNGLVPDEILYGKKRGFDVPYREWLRNDLYEFFKGEINSSSSVFFDNQSILNILEIHKKRQADYGDLLWKILVLVVWMSIYNNKISN